MIEPAPWRSRWMYNKMSPSCRLTTAHHFRYCKANSKQNIWARINQISFTLPSCSYIHIKTAVCAAAYCHGQHKIRKRRHKMARKGWTVKLAEPKKMFCFELLALPLSKLHRARWSMRTRAEAVRSAVTESGVGKSGLHEKPDLPEAVHERISEKGYLPPHTRNMHPKLSNVYSILSQFFRKSTVCKPSYSRSCLRF